MIYQAYQAQNDALEAWRVAAEATAGLFEQSPFAAFDLSWSRSLAALLKVSAFAGLSHKRPPFNISRVKVGNREVQVTEESFDETPFCTLLHFKKDIAATQPPVLLVAPISGHFATLLRETAEVVLADHDVYITDWKNPRDVSVREGRFGFDEFVDHLIRFLGKLGSEAHLLAICQPCVGALAAAAILAEDGNPAEPRSITLMAGPIDTRINPTSVNRFAMSRPIDWFERNLIGVVPQGYAGALRRVYPGFLQLTAFMGMNPSRHLKSFQDLYNHMVRDDPARAETVKDFYREYFAVMDLTAEFYLETVERIFHQHLLPKGELVWRGRKIDPAAIRHPQLLTVEGDRDDICAIGQTLAAQDLCSRLRPYKKHHYVQSGAGHYGVFAGRRWATQIYPVVRDIIHHAAA